MATTTYTLPDPVVVKAVLANEVLQLDASTPAIVLEEAKAAEIDGDLDELLLELAKQRAFEVLDALMPFSGPAEEASDLALAAMIDAAAGKVDTAQERAAALAHLLNLGRRVTARARAFRARVKTNREKRRDAREARKEAPDA